MNVIFWKELRALRLPFAITVCMIVIGVLLADAMGGRLWLTSSLPISVSPSVYSFFIVAFQTGCLLIGACAFGSEFQHKTMGILLTQPVSRRRIWFLKLCALAMALFGALVFMWVANQFLTPRIWMSEERDSISQTFAVTPWLLFGVLCTLPFYTLAMRNTLTGLVVSFVAPGTLLGGGLLGIALVERLTSFQAQALLDWLTDHYHALFLCYCLLIYWCGYRRFLNYEEVESKGNEIKLPAGLREALSPTLNAFKPSYSSPIKSLVRKELELQKGVFIIAAAVFVMLGCEMIAWQMHPAESTSAIMAATLICFTMLAPTMIGVTCVAEERHLGALTWQLTLPVSRRIQWRVKFGTALATWVAVGIVLPIIWVAIGKSLMGVPADFVDGFYRSLPIYLGGFLLSVFASSFSSNAMRAVLISIVLAWACAGETIALLMHFSETVSAYPHLTAFFGWVFRYFHGQPTSSLLLLCVALGWCALLVFMAGANFRRNDSSKIRCWLQSIVVVGYFCVSVPLLQSAIWGQVRTNERSLGAATHAKKLTHE